MTVARKIINANAQPNGGCGVVGVAGARALDSTSFLDSNHTLNPSPLSPSFIDQPITTINKLDTRYDDPRYYSGDSAS